MVRSLVAFANSTMCRPVIDHNANGCINVASALGITQSNNTPIGQEITEQDHQLHKFKETLAKRTREVKEIKGTKEANETKAIKEIK